MTLSFLLPAAWGLVLLVALIGYGKLVRRFLTVDEPAGWAIEAALGMAFVVALGGGLNLLKIISPTLVLILVGAGAIIALVATIKQKEISAEKIHAHLARFKHDRPAFLLKAVGLGIILALVAVQYLASVSLEIHHWNYVLMDDLRGYFLFPKQMLETGAITADPFNFMRLGNGLGGQAILQAFVLVFFDFYNLLLAEAGIALIVCVGLVWKIAASRGLGFFWRWLLAVVFLCLPYYPTLRINTSSFTSGMAMLLVIFVLLDAAGPAAGKPIRRALLIALPAACAVALKTTFLPPLVIVLAISYLWYLVSAADKKSAALEILLVPTMVILFLLPWMLALLESSGTPLYHILGTGFDEYNYGNYIYDTEVGGFSLGRKLKFIYLTYFSREIYLTLILTTLAGLLIIKPRPRATAQAFALGTLIAAVIVMINVDVTKTVSLHRYIYGGVFVALLGMVMELMAAAARHDEQGVEGSAVSSFGHKAAKLKRLIALASLLGAAVLFFWKFDYADRAWSLYKFHWHSLPKQLQSSDKFIPDDWKARYRQAQETVPEGATILSLDTATAAYDFSRHEIYYLTMPGACSLPPGIPYFAGAEKIADYFLSHGIRYLAYSYVNDGGFPIEENLKRIRPDAGYFNRILERAAIALNLAFKELGGSRKRLYDDGSIFILDLEQSARVRRTYQPPNYFQQAGILSPAWADTSGFGRNKIWTDGHGVIEGILYQMDRQDRILALNTFGYHPWKGDIGKLGLVLSVNGIPLPLMGFDGKSYFFSLAPIRVPITRISIDSTTFVPREEKVRFGKDDDGRTLGIDVDTIEIKALP